VTPEEGRRNGFCFMCDETGVNGFFVEVPLPGARLCCVSSVRQAVSRSGLGSNCVMRRDGNIHKRRVMIGIN